MSCVWSSFLGRQNVETLLVTGTRKIDHITPVSQQLDWLEGRLRECARGTRPETGNSNIFCRVNEARCRDPQGAQQPGTTVSVRRLSTRRQFQVHYYQHKFTY